MDAEMSERKGSIVIISGARDRQGTLYDLPELFFMYPDLFARSVVTGHAEVHGLTYVRQKDMKREVATLPMDVLDTLIERLDSIMTEDEKRADQARLHKAWRLAGYAESRCADCDDSLDCHGSEFDEDAPECRAPKCGDGECGCECGCLVFTFKPGEGSGPAAA